MQFPLAEATNRRVSPIRILVVEDNPDQQVLIRYALQQSIAEVQPICVDRADEAISYLDACVAKQLDLPNLVLLDLYLPDAEQGWELLRQLKEYPAQQRLPVVVLSMSNAEEDVQRSYDLGANSYIAKPLDYEQWLTYFHAMRQYWWETATLPKQAYNWK
jgi:CheY-like chemotaxis protein